MKASRNIRLLLWIWCARDLLHPPKVCPKSYDLNNFYCIPTATSPVYYIAMLTSLFEGMALIIDQHQPIIEKYYGSDKMVVVVRRLIEECDHVVTRLCEGWVEERSAKRKAIHTISDH